MVSMKNLNADGDRPYLLNVFVKMHHRTAFRQFLTGHAVSRFI